ncbi:MAG: tetrahydromethanopterin S-methyltransferase subunit F [Methanobacterium sp.]|jgi:tetrahydromethanopterin S-methyltransferase subunit F
MKISNKPNVRGMEKVANDVTYRSAIMGRDLRLFMGIITTRIYGVSLGFILAVALILIPAVVVIYGGSI